MSGPLCARLHCVENSRELVLAGSSVEVSIVDVHASVFLSQKFTNMFGLAVAATYTFTMVAGAAICGFEMIREDGTKVEGIVKEKAEAKQEYEEAIRQGFTAGLGEEETKDIFSTSVGNILPAEVVTINLRFIQPLIDDEKRDQVRFLFPRGYTQRYGSPPMVNTAFVPVSMQPFKMEMIIQQAGSIQSVNCSSGHSVVFQPGPPEGITAIDTAHFARLTLTERSSNLAEDVVVVISATNLDKPRCFVEPHPSPSHTTTAVGLTFVPRFNLPDVKGGMEYIFVVDRSGSMQCQSMELAREALIILLRGLPTMETTFNIVSFGDRSSTLWPSSKNYNQETLDLATQHVDSMQADYRGTQIASALDTTFNSLSKPLKKAVAILLLTDGAAWDVESCVSRVETAARDLPRNDTFIRVFTVGIGNGASTHTCDSIARAGNGLALYVGQGEAMAGKCSRLIRAARTPPIVNLEVEWPGSEKRSSIEDDFEMVESDVAPQDTTPVNLFQSDAEEEPVNVGPPSFTLPPPLEIQQAPITVPSIFPGSRMQIYALLSNTVFPKGSTFPSSLKVRGQVQTTGTTVEMDVPVANLLLSRSQSEGIWRPILHTLAAKALITEHESGKFGRSSIKNGVIDAYLQKEIVRLGTTYGLSSRHTSFIAVDRRSAAASQVIPVKIFASVGSSFGYRPDKPPPPPPPPAGPMTNEHLWAAPLPRPAYKRLARLPNPHFFAAPPSVGTFGTPSPTGSMAFGNASPGMSMGIGAVPPVQDNAVMPYASYTRPPAGPMTNVVFHSPPPPAPSLNGHFFAAPSPIAPILMSRDFGTAHPIRVPKSARLPKSAPQRQTAVIDRRHVQSQRDKERESGWNDAAEIDRKKAGEEDSKFLEPSQRLTAIARLQRFDGGFALSDKLLQLLQTSIQDVEAVKSQFFNLGIDPDVVATMLASVWLGKYAGEETDDMIRKAEEWIGQKGGLAISELSVKVISLVSFL